MRASRGPIRTLYVDIETAPNLAHVWGLWKQNISLNQLLESTEMLCFAAKWRDQKRVQFYSTFHNGQDEMRDRAWELLDQADAVVHYNGRRFDVPHLNREFVLAGKTPPSPYRQVDLLQVVQKRFRFPSNKLAYVSQALGLDGKVQHEGHTLWVRCMAGDPKAWATMRRYNRRDVTLLQDLHDVLLPWVPGHPNVALVDGSDVDACPKCGGEDLERRGYAYTPTGQFQQYRCRGCGSWLRSGKRIASVDLREVAT